MRSIAFSRKPENRREKNFLYLVEEVLVWLFPLHRLSASKASILCFCKKKKKKKKKFLFFSHINWSSHHESSFRHWFIFPCPCLRRLFFDILVPLFLSSSFVSSLCICIHNTQRQNLYVDHYSPMVWILEHMAMDSSQSLVLIRHSLGLTRVSRAHRHTCSLYIVAIGDEYSAHEEYRG